jgi:hypothetical protein
MIAATTAETAGRDHSYDLQDIPRDWSSEHEHDRSSAQPPQQTGIVIDRWS